MSATRYGGTKVNDVLVRSNILRGRQTADAEASAAHLCHDLATGYEALGNYEALETTKPRNYEALETSISSLSALASSMRFTKRLLSCTSRTVLVRVTQD